jgi:Fic-DOC domain mobile mystery protein B
MSDLLAHSRDSTPLTPEQGRQLRPTWITTQEQLNAEEQRNNAAAEQWAFGRKGRAILTLDFIKILHKRMFGEVWKWAGTWRAIDVIFGENERQGSHPAQIEIQVYSSLKDVEHWVQQTSGRISDEQIAVALHHRLTQIHSFANGNGRHARLMGDLLITQLGGQRFTWGRGNLREEGALGQSYMAALRAADDLDLGPLVAFARS